MKKALILLLDQYADWEAVHLCSILNTSETWSVKTISTVKQVTSIGGISVLIDFIVGEEPTDYDLLIMVGGNAWNTNDKKLLSFVSEAFENKRPIGAICGAVDYLARNGFLNKYKHTGNDVAQWNNFEQYVAKELFIAQQAVIDSHLVTANGTAYFELTELILKLIEFDTSEEIEKLIYLYKHGYYSYSEKYGSPY